MSGAAVSIFFISFISGCMGESEFRDRVTSALARSDQDAIAARSCADELRAITGRTPGIAEYALEVQGGPTRAPWVPPPGITGSVETLASQARTEIAGRERALAGDRKLIEGSVAVGPAALGRVGQAVEHADLLRAALCQARDLANELAGRIDAHSLPEQVMSLKEP